MPHGYTNATSTDGRRVVKRYLGPDAAERQSAETLALTRLAGRLPVPVLLDQTDGRIEVGWIAGVPGQERLETDPEQVLYVVGETARRLLSLDVDAVPGLPRRPGGEVLVHGDFGPQNLLLDRDTGQLTAIVDWEFTHIGDRLTDIAWAEWILRTHHPHLVGALPSLFAGYQDRPVGGAAGGDAHPMRGASGLRPALARRGRYRGAAVAATHRRHRRVPRMRPVRTSSAPGYRLLIRDRASSGLSAPDATSARIWSRVRRGSGSGSSPARACAADRQTAHRAVG